MKQILFISISILVICLSGKAQDKKRDSGIIFLLGPSGTYQIPAIDEGSDYNENLLSWQIDSQLGFISTRNQTNRGNMLMAFGNVGAANNAMLQEIMQSSIYAEKVTADRSFNPYYSIEGGMIIFKLLRISGGAGRQYFTLAEDETLSCLKYFTGTAGLNFDFGAVNLGINATMLTGRELEQSLIRLNMGFLVKF
ncbi:MAG: hypothetical protein MUE95_10155 [Cyclobacteriaceae bacterium]|jgi:hypothetical protein|nr:hypothetical protein [Cyclobacteriaceae bacterium]